jgi:predicted nucleotidyltransferase
MRVDRFLNDVEVWASSRDDLLAAALVGSHARNTATEESDVDLVLIASDPATYLEDITWTSEFGRVRHSQVEHYGNLTSLRVRYEGGLEVEFGLTDETWIDLPLEEGTRSVIAAGMRILFEREPLLSRWGLDSNQQPSG